MELYKLDNISLSLFIRVFNGEHDLVIKSGKANEDTINEYVEKLIHEYIGIVGGNGASRNLSRKNEMLNLAISIEALNVCDQLYNLERWEDVCSILKWIGFTLNPDDRDGIKKRISALMATKTFHLERLRNLDNEEHSDKIDPDYFTKEIVLIMTHFKMQIDKDKITAKEYAYMSKRMSDEIEAQIKAMKKTK